MRKRKDERVDFTSWDHSDLGAEREWNSDKNDSRREFAGLEAAGLVRLKGRYTYLPPTLHLFGHRQSL